MIFVEVLLCMMRFDFTSCVFCSHRGIYWDIQERREGVSLHR